MFLQILKTMIRVILVFSILIIAFGLTFYMLLANTVSSIYTAANKAKAAADTVLGSKRFHDSNDLYCTQRYADDG
jgi:hypothetical protein